jgi:hypothetical protein
MGGQMMRRAVGGWALLFCVVNGAVSLSGCTQQENEAFVKSHDSIQTGMTLRDVFGSGLADYLMIMGTKNVVGATIPDKRPAASHCERHVLDISYGGAFRVRIYCSMNSPTAPQLLPERGFEGKEALLRALDNEYASWAKNMEFRVESPPRKFDGVYDHYRFVMDPKGQVAVISAIVASPEGR